MSFVRAEPVISEFMASNATTLRDEDGAYSDWIELHNPDAAPIDLAGWYLTDTATNKTKWQLPSVTLPANGYLVVFASKKDRRDPANRLHTNFVLSAGGEYLGLIKPDGATVASEYAPVFPPQRTDIAYGIPAAAGARAADYLRTPTPGQPNSSADSALAESVAFSRPAGPFQTTFSVELSGATGGNKIRYVVVPSSAAATASEPNATSREYTGPITVAESTLIRAAVFSPDGQAHGPIATSYYAKLGASITRFASQLPVLIVDSLGSGTLVQDDIDHPSWLYTYTARGNGQPTFAAAPELITPLEVSVRGSSSVNFPKKSYTISFADESGRNRAVPLLDLPAFEKWTLVGPWSYDLSYINNSFVYTLSNQMGRWAPRTRLVEVFLNSNGGEIDASDYVGIYAITDRIELDEGRVDLTNMSKSSTSGAAVTGGYILKIDVKDADDISWVTRRNIPETGYSSIVLVEPKADEIAPAQLEYIQTYVQKMEDALAADVASGFSHRTYLDYLDRDSWVDHHILNTFVCNPDGFVRSAYFTKDRNGKLKAGPVWDFDRAIGSYSDDRSSRYDVWANLGSPDYWRTGWWGLLAQDPEFMQDWIDRWQSLRRGPLEDSNLLSIIDSNAKLVGEEAVRRDAARWPENVSPWGSYAAQIDQMKRWIKNRTRWIDEQFVRPPTVAVRGSEITFTPVAGTQLAYTLDGSDPRTLGAGVAPNARLTSAPLTVPLSANVHVRSYQESLRTIFPGSPWSSAVGSEASTPLTPRSRIINLSTRAAAGGGDDALIVGMVVADTTAKRYLTRAVGPGLAAFGAADFMSEPQLELVTGGAVELFRNQGWETGHDAARIPSFARAAGAFPLAAGSRDCALAEELSAGTYMLQVKSATNQTGVVLAELYELDGCGRTVNLSTRAHVRATGDSLVGGFVVQGSAYKRMLIRAAGPTLASLGVGGALRDPVLSVYAGTTAVATNDRWDAEDSGAVVAAATKSAGAFPFAAHSEDAALLISVPPGAYTVEVKGKQNAEGIALLEVYEVP